MGYLAGEIARLQVCESLLLLGFVLTIRAEISQSALI